MKKLSLLTSFIIVVAFCSCRKDEEKITNRAICKGNNMTQLVNVIYRHADTIVDNDFMAVFLDNMHKVKDNLVNYRYSYTTQRNKHYPEATDTIYSYYNRHNDSVRILRNQYSELLLSVNINSHGIDIYKGLKIGMARNEISRMLGKKELADVFYITDVEESSIVQFSFHHDILQNVSYESFYID